MCLRNGLTALIPTALLCAVVALAAGTRQDVDEEAARPAKVVRQALTAGKWQSHRAAADKRDWRVQFKHMEDGSVEGRITVMGGKLQQVRLQGRVDGGEVYGVLLDDNDSQVGNFSGKVDGQSASGTYRTNDGDDGEWSMN